MRVGRDDRWYDDAGPLVRPYTLAPHAEGESEAMAHGQAFAVGEDAELLDLLAQVSFVPGAGTDTLLGPEHTVLLDTCRRTPHTPLSVAELAVTTGRPVGVVRVLLGDLRRRGHLCVRGPAASAPPSRASVVGILSEVIDGIRAL